jgi:hypothetical protein
MKFLEGYRRIAALVILVIPHLASMLGHPIAGEDVAPVVNGIADLAAGALVLWSKVKPDAPKP